MYRYIYICLISLPLNSSFYGYFVEHDLYTAMKIYKYNEIL